MELANKRATERENEYLRGRYASRGEPRPRQHRRQGRATGPDPWGGDTGVRGAPYPGEVQRHSVTGFNILVERARVLRLSQGPSVSPPVCKSPSSDSSHSVPASPTRPTIQGRLRLHVLPTTTIQCGPPLDGPARHETGRSADKSQNTSPTPAVTDDAARKLGPYLASIDNTLKELGPCLAQVNVLAPYLDHVAKILEQIKRLERRKQRQTPVVTSRPKSRVPTPTKTKQQTVIKYIVRKD